MVAVAGLSTNPRRESRIMESFMADIEYIMGGMFTRFLPNTSAGEVAWREMERQGGEVVFNHQDKNVIGQLRRAEYSVAKAKKCTMTIDDILAELGA
jgi:hypothetical protein